MQALVEQIPARNLRGPEARVQELAARLRSKVASEEEGPFDWLSTGAASCSQDPAGWSLRQQCSSLVASMTLLLGAPATPAESCTPKSHSTHSETRGQVPTKLPLWWPGVASAAKRGQVFRSAVLCWKASAGHPRGPCVQAAHRPHQQLRHLLTAQQRDLAQHWTSSVDRAGRSQ